MRVVGGRLRSRPISGPRSAGLRPTADRLRESLFNILAHAYGDPVTDARVLDLFAGTGALGIEAISRGTAFALFVDDGVEARALLRDNVGRVRPARGPPHFPPPHPRPCPPTGSVLAPLPRPALLQGLGRESTRFNPGWRLAHPERSGRG